MKLEILLIFNNFDFKTVLFIFAGKGRLYPAYSLSGSDGEADSPSPRRYQQSHNSQHTYQHPLYQQAGAGLSDTPTSDNASDATLTDSELALARDSTLLVHNGEFIFYILHYLIVE